MESIPLILWIGAAVALVTIGYGIKELLCAIAERIRSNFWRDVRRPLDNSNPSDWD